LLACGSEDQGTQIILAQLSGAKTSFDEEETEHE